MAAENHQWLPTYQHIHPRAGVGTRDEVSSSLRITQACEAHHDFAFGAD